MKKNPFLAILLLLLAIPMAGHCACTILQTSSESTVSGASTSVSNTITGVTSGSTLVPVVFGHYWDTTTPTFSGTSDGTNSYTAASTHSFTNTYPVLGGMWYRHNVGSGSHTITAQIGPNNDGPYAKMVVIEVAGLANSAPQVATPVGTETATLSITRAAMASDNRCMIGLLSMGSLTFGNTTFTSPATMCGTTGAAHINDQVDDSYEGNATSRSITNGTAGCTASWGTASASRRVVMLLAGFEETGGGGTAFNPLSGRGAGAAQPLVVP